MSPRPVFSAFGIPVSFDPWFLFGCFIFYQLSGGCRPGLFAAGFMVVFVVIHEFGHALAARGFGHSAEIVVSFLGGWTAHGGSARLPPSKRAIISVAGPLAQLFTALPALVAAELLSTNDPELRIDLFNAIGWTGVVLAIMNLLPLWPLDGGHLVVTAIERLGKPHLRRAYLQVSLAFSGVLLLIGLQRGTVGELIMRPFEQLASGIGFGTGLSTWLKMVILAPGLALTSTLFIGLFCALSSWQALQVANLGQVTVQRNGVDRRQVEHSVHEAAVRNAERSGWETHQVQEFPKGTHPSPWLQAHLAARQGASPSEVAAVLTRLGHSSRSWVLDDPGRPELDALIDMVPPSAATSLGALEVRRYHGNAEQFLELCAMAAKESGSAEPLYLAAEGLSVRGKPEAAVEWLRAAVEMAPDPARMALSKPLRPCNGRVDFQQLLGQAERTAVSRR